MQFNVFEKFKASKKKEQQITSPEQSKIVLRELPSEEIDEIVLEWEQEGKIEKILSKLKGGNIEPETLKAVAKLALKLGSKLSGYDTILSDDVSGRLPSLLFRKVIEHERNFSGKPPVQTFFLSGGTSILHAQEAISSFINNKQKVTGGLGKTLLVTEYIESGRSMKKLAETLEDGDVDFDIAAVSVLNEEKDYDDILTKRLYFGKEQSFIGLDLYGSRKSVGVEKAPYFKVPFDEEFSAHPYRLESRNTEAMKNSRADMNLIAEELIDLLDKIYRK